MTQIDGVKVVVIGGGTGSFTLLSGLKNYVQDITALVNMADDGGSTGVLRDELGALPPGDVRQCLVALSRSSETMRQLFNYRFPKDSFAGGHSFGNLFLSAVEKITDNFAHSVELASQVLNIVGKVVPITLDNIRLEMHHANGDITKNEHAIDVAHFTEMRPDIRLQPNAAINPEARKAILKADLIVVAPGDIYTSLAPAFLVDGVSEALKETKARVVYVCNLVTKPGQTDDFKVHDFAAEIERFIGHPRLDYILYNTAMPEADLMKKYANEHEYAVEVDEDALKSVHYQPISAKLVANDVFKKDKNDTLARSWIRHDTDQVVRQLMKIYWS